MEYEVIEMPSAMVAAIDKVDKFWQKFGSKDGYVHHRGDWKVIVFTYELFKISYPHEAKIFAETQKNIRNALKREDGGIVKKETGVRMRHVANIPEKMFSLINTFYPRQKWDKKFVVELAQHLPVISVPKKL